MAQFYNNQQSPGKDRPFNVFAPFPIVLNRAPTSNDIADLSTLWLQNVDTNGNPINGLWVLTNPGVWTPLETSGGIGNFTSLTVSPGLTTLSALTQTGTANINTSGSGVTSIGVGGTGAVNIGNATGNTTISAGNLSVTSGNISAPAGSISSGLGITAGNGLTVTSGNATLTNGNLVLSTAATYISLPGPVFIYSGAGAPAGGLALHIGDLYINTSAASATTRMYIATAVGTWTNFTTAA